MVRMGQSPACPPKWQNEKRKEKHDNLQIWELNSFLLYKMTLSIPKTNIVVQLIPEIGKLGGKGAFCTPQMAQNTTFQYYRTRNAPKTIKPYIIAFLQTIRMFWYNVDVTLL